MNQNIYKESIIVIGPVGVGKSTVSRRLGEVNRMPVIITDLLKHCPKDLGGIYLQRSKIRTRINELKDDIEYNSKCDKYKANKELRKLNNDMWVLDKQVEMRMLLPNVKNFSDFGFKPEVSVYLRERFGDVAWHYYQKQFENKFMQDLINNLPKPCVIDMGGGLPISLDEEYVKLDKEFRSIDEKLYLQNFDLDGINFEIIKTMLEPFKNVVELELSTDYKKYDSRASRDPLNDVYLSTKQYGQLAKKTINASGLFSEDKLNDRALDGIVRVINKHVQSEDLEM